MVVFGLTGLAVLLLLLLFLLWFFFGPDRQPGPPLAPLDPLPTFDPLSPFRYREPRPPLSLLPHSLEVPCEECNAVTLVWSRDPFGRPDTWVGICRRCGRVRLDAACGQLLVL